MNAADVDGDTALHYAVGWNSEEVIAALAAAGAKVDAPDRTGRTPLMHAAKMGFLRAVQALLDAGANPSLRNRAGNTALRLAKMSHPRILLANPPGTVRLLEQALAR